jgi:hypothetical protein
MWLSLNSNLGQPCTGALNSKLRSIYLLDVGFCCPCEAGYYWCHQHVLGPALPCWNVLYRQSQIEVSLLPSRVIFKDCWCLSQRIVCKEPTPHHLHWTAEQHGWPHRLPDCHRLHPCDSTQLGSFLTTPNFYCSGSRSVHCGAEGCACGCEDAPKG